MPIVRTVGRHLIVESCQKVRSVRIEETWNDCVCDTAELMLFKFLRLTEIPCHPVFNSELPRLHSHVFPNVFGLSIVIMEVVSGSLARYWTLLNCTLSSPAITSETFPSEMSVLSSIVWACIRNRHIGCLLAILDILFFMICYVMNRSMRLVSDFQMLMEDSDDDLKELIDDDIFEAGEDMDDPFPLLADEETQPPPLIEQPYTELQHIEQPSN
ncbi:hypothetical protein Tco_0550308 [Tanacetum coccineum]